MPKGRGKIRHYVQDLDDHAAFYGWERGKPTPINALTAGFSRAVNLPKIKQWENNQSNKGSIYEPNSELESYWILGYDLGLRMLSLKKQYQEILRHGKKALSSSPLSTRGTINRPGKTESYSERFAGLSQRSFGIRETKKGE